MKTTKQIFQIIAWLNVLAIIYVAYCFFNPPKFLFGHLIVGFPECVIGLGVALLCVTVVGICDNVLNERKLAEKDREMDRLTNEIKHLTASCILFKGESENADKKCKEYEAKILEFDLIENRRKYLEDEVEQLNKQIGELIANRDEIIEIWEPIDVLVRANDDYFGLKVGDSVSGRTLEVLTEVVNSGFLIKEVHPSLIKPRPKAKSKTSTRKRERV